MIEIWAFDVGSGVLGNCAEFIHGVALAARQTPKAFPQSFCLVSRLFGAGMFCSSRKSGDMQYRRRCSGHGAA